MLKVLRRWRDRRRAVQAAADELITEFGADAWTEARLRPWRVDFDSDEFHFLLAVSDEVTKRLRPDWCSDTATRYVEGTVGGMGNVRRG